MNRGLITDLETPEHLRGYMRAVQISLSASNPLDVAGIYMPTTHPLDTNIRTQAYYLSTV
jgi:hypothetical protein